MDIYDKYADYEDQYDPEQQSSFEKGLKPNTAEAWPLQESWNDTCALLPRRAGMGVCARTYKNGQTASCCHRIV